MTSTKDVIPYAPEQKGTILETTTVLSKLLRPHYTHQDINDLAVGTFIDNERRSIGEPSTLHLLSLKKTLLYAIPIISNDSSGIPLTSQVVSPAIRYDFKKRKAQSCALAIGDKFKLIGVAFPSGPLINHLHINVFPWKYAREYPTHHIPSAIDLSDLPAVESKSSQHGQLYLIRPKHYEDVDLFNEINRRLSTRLAEDMAVTMSMKPMVESTTFHVQPKLAPFNENKIIHILNNILIKQIDPTFTMAFYEALNMTSNWLLYDHIQLLGVESPEVKASISKLAYIKEQTLKVQANVILVQKQQLLATRAEKIAREQYPQYFDFTHREARFVRFNRFSLDKLSKKEQDSIKVLLEKDFAEQEAILNNKCEHVRFLQNVDEFSDSFTESFQEIEKYIDYEAPMQDGMYACKLCSYQIACSHTVDLYETIVSSASGVDSLDKVYQARQHIINKYKLTNQRRTGDEDTETNFTFYCKHCSAELGKSADIIQAGIGTMSGSSLKSDNPLESEIYTNVYAAIKMYVNQSVLPINSKTITRLIFDEIKDMIALQIQRVPVSQQSNIETLVKYLSYTHAIAGVIAINAAKLKSDNILIDPSLSKKANDVRSVEPVEGGGDQLKDNLRIAYNILQSVPGFKTIGITGDKIKSTLINAFKLMTNSFSGETIQAKPASAADRLKMDVLSSPLVAYASFMKYKDCNCEVDPFEITGIDMSRLYPKSKKVSALDTHSLYTNMYQSKNKVRDDTDKYVQESYQSIVNLATKEPIAKRYLSEVAPEISDFAKQFEAKRSSQLKLKRTIPLRFLPVENSREYNYELENYQIAYCLLEDGTTSSHRWLATKKDNKITYTCKHCSLTLDKASKSNNDKIDDRLYEKMSLEAFFELYTIACPIKDIHVFDKDQCVQCSGTKDQLAKLDLKYYKKYSSVHRKQKDLNTKRMLEDSSSIISYSTPLPAQTKKEKTAPAKVDLIKLDSLAFSLSKLYNQSDLKLLGVDEESKVRSFDEIDSYVRLFYSHYLFAKNITINIASHPDPEFFAFVKDLCFDGIKKKQITLSQLPTYPTSKNADQLLIDFFNIVYDVSTKGSNQSTALIKFIMNKICIQSKRHRKYNFAKLKTVQSDKDDLLMNADDDDNAMVNDDEEEFDMFDGYDISSDDLEDNIDGDID